MVDVTKVAGDTSLNNESFVYCVIYDFVKYQNNHGVNMRLPLETQNTKSFAPSPPPRAPPLDACWWLRFRPPYRLALRARHRIQLNYVQF